MELPPQYNALLVSIMYAKNYTREDKNNRGLRRHICGDIILKDRVQTNIEKY